MKSTKQSGKDHHQQQEQEQQSKPSFSDLDRAIDSGDWAAVGALGALLNANDDESDSPPSPPQQQQQQQQHPVLGKNSSLIFPTGISLNQKNNNEEGNDNEANMKRRKVNILLDQCEAIRFPFKKKLLLENLNLLPSDIPLRNLDGTALGNSLHKLSLNGNRLMEIPSKLVQCFPTLKTLDLSQCELQQLPNKWHLPQLKRLNLSHNRLTEFPTESMLQGLLELQDLNMYGNKVSEIIIPKNPKVLAKLKSINLGYNDIAYIPDDLDQLKELQILKIMNNFLDIIPKRICEMKELRTLDISSNPLLYPPIETCERGIPSMKRYYQQMDPKQLSAIQKMATTKMSTTTTTTAATNATATKANISTITNPANTETPDSFKTMAEQLAQQIHDDEKLAQELQNNAENNYVLNNWKCPRCTLSNSQLVDSCTACHLRNPTLDNGFEEEQYENLEKYTYPRPRASSSSSSPVTPSTQISTAAASSSSGWSHPILKAAHDGDIVSVKQLVAENLDYLNERSKFGLLPLHLAAKYGHLDIVQFIIKTKPDCVREKNNESDTALHLACYNNHLKVVEYLVKVDPKSLQEKNIFGDTALHLAAYNGNLSVVVFILKNDSSLRYQKDDNGNTPLNVAKQRGHDNVVTVLTLSAKFDTPTENQKNTSTIKAATGDSTDTKNESNMSSISWDEAQLLLDDMNSSNNDDGSDNDHDNTPLVQSPIHKACEEGILIKAMELVRSDPSVIFQTDTNDNTPLHTASQNGHLPIVMYLVEIYPRELSKANKNIHSPFELAIIHGHQDIVDFMLQYYCVVGDDGDTDTPNNYLDANIQSALELAQEHNQTAIATSFKSISENVDNELFIKLVKSLPHRTNIDAKIKELEPIIQTQARSLSEFDAWEKANKTKKILSRMCFFDKYQSIEELQDRIEDLKEELQKWAPEHRRPLFVEIDRYEKQLQAEKDELNKLKQADVYEQSSKLLYAAWSDLSTRTIPELSPVYLIKTTNNFSTRLGGGGFADVYLGTDSALSSTTESIIEFAVKRYKRERVNGARRDIIQNQIQREIDVLVTFEHSNIVRILGYCLPQNDPTMWCVVYEYAAGGSLQQALSDPSCRKLLDRGRRLDIAKSLVAALKFLHDHNCSHRDVKPDNICFSNDLSRPFCRIILVDFGLSKLVDEVDYTQSVYGNVGWSHPYVAPERQIGPEYRFTERSEVYSVGFVFQALITGKLPTVSSKSLGLRGMVDHADTVWTESALHNKDILTVFATIAAKCMHHDENDRYSLGELQQEIFHLASISEPPLTQEQTDTIESAIYNSTYAHSMDNDVMMMSVGDNDDNNNRYKCGKCHQEMIKDNRNGVRCNNNINRFIHYLCNYCFGEYVKTNLGCINLPCYSFECLAEPFTEKQFEQHLPNGVLFCHLIMRNDAMARQREQKKTKLAK